MLRPHTCLLLLLGAAPMRLLADPQPPPSVRVQIDSSRKTVTITAGPFTIPGNHAAAAAGHDHHAAGAQTPFLRFAWPVSGWLYGFDLTVTDAGGQPLPRKVIHHVNVMNLERRALLYDAVERTLAVGSETDDVQLPRSVGFPLRAGTAMGLLAAWANDSHEAIEGVRLVIRFRWSPTNLNPRPLDVLPLYLDVNYQRPGQSVSYDLAPGRTVRSFEFTLPLEGRLLGVGGHLHDYGEELYLEEVESGRQVVRLKARTGPDGKLQQVERRLFGVTGDGIRLREGRRYRLTAVYQNPTGATIPNGAMGIMIGLFAPADLRQWPRVDPTNPGIRADIEALGGLGSPPDPARP